MRACVWECKRPLNFGSNFPRGGASVLFSLNPSKILNIFSQLCVSNSHSSVRCPCMFDWTLKRSKPSLWLLHIGRSFILYLAQLHVFRQYFFSARVQLQLIKDTSMCCVVKWKHVPEASNMFESLSVTQHKQLCRQKSGGLHSFQSSCFSLLQCALVCAVSKIVSVDSL